ncbi:hypothetical protein CEXT_109801 [Caerostris extrusa]|uniref:Uncharacterized protein n=1 Tax=Caerostris extrusa TaxID=172846 RepID=A0AAV4QQQ6_CAEEX|nr:hypothetical protein CEXT_109801 [Caerostris extrusa]
MIKKKGEFKNIICFQKNLSSFTHPHTEARFVKIRKPLRFHKSASIRTKQVLCERKQYSAKHLLAEPLYLATKLFSSFARFPIPALDPCQQQCPLSLNGRKSLRITNDNC